MIILPPTIIPRPRPQLATYVIDTIEAAGVRVPPSSRLWRMHRLLHSRHTIIQPDHPDYEIALEAERDLQLLGFVFDQCASASPTPAYLERLEKLVCDSVLPQDNRIKSPGRDAGFELYVGGVCTAAQLFPVSWDEPDVTCVWAGVKYGFAAKRIKSIKSLEDRVGDAVDQIERSGLPCVIVLDVGVAFNPENHRIAQMPETVFWSDYFKHCRATWSEHQAKVQSLMEPEPVLGLIVHDYHVRMQRGQWALAGMTMPVVAAARSIEDQRLFDQLAYLYTRGLPNQDDVSNLPLWLP